MSDQLATGQLGAPVWLGEAIVVVGLSLLAFALVRWLVRHAAAPLARVVARLLGGLVGLLGVVLLLAEYLCTRAIRLLRQRPPGIAYAYGALVRQATVASRAELTVLAGRAGVVRRAPGWLILVLVAASLAGWNQVHCATGAGRRCQHPAAVWYRSMVDWWGRVPAAISGTPSPGGVATCPPAATQPCTPPDGTPH
jgi:hypothetical protein